MNDTSNLGAMTNYNQFVVWHAVKHDGEDKPRKIPFNVNDPERRGADPHDPSNWLSYDHAKHYATELDCGFGFVLTKDDPFFCIDLDACLEPEGHWSSFSQGIVDKFPGALVEVSFSGNGLHIFGVAQAPIDHRNKVKGDGWEIEVYTHSRYIAIGSRSTGDPWLDHSVEFNKLLDLYLPGHKIDGTEWTSVPDPEWFGPKDDAELLRRMLMRKPTAKQMFGQGATVQDLWSRNVPKLAIAFPNNNPKSDAEYDGNSADFAFCLHLAFWTGKDCGRIDRLFRMSKLMRPKWDRGRDPYQPGQYLHDTVTKACAATHSVYKETKKEVERLNLISSDPQAVMVSEIKTREGLQLLMVQDQLTHFEGCVYIIDAHRVLTPDGSLLAPEQFKAVYGGYEFVISAENKTVMCAWETFTRSRVAQFPKAHSLCFRPELPFGAIVNMEGKSLVNSYTPSTVRIIEGDPSPFLDCIKKQLPDPADRAILLAYAAACVQHKGVKFQWCPMIQGTEGNGKSLIMRCVSKAVGERYTHFPNAADLGNKFNSWLLGKLFIGIEEIYVTDRRECLDALKTMVTNDRIEIQAKGRDQFTGDNRANLIMCSNHRDAIMKTKNDRRYAVFYTAQQTNADIIRDGMGGMYFPDLYKWLNKCDGYEIVAHYLTNYAIPDELNPTTTLHRAPDTSSTAQAILESLGAADQEVLAAIAEDRVGFRDGWVSSLALGLLMKDKNYRYGPRKRGQMLERLGFVVHPGLTQGKAPNRILEEKGRPILYCLDDPKNDVFKLRGSAAIMERYTSDQGYIRATTPLKIANNN